jgi:tetratricopeptide (TPR) repeat protein
MERYRLIIFSCVFALSIPNAISQSADDYIRRGDSAYAQCLNDSAKVEYEQAYKLEPDSFAVLKRMATVYNDEGRALLHSSDSSEEKYRKAIPFARELVARYPDMAESHFCLALCLGSLIPFQSVRQKIAGSKEVLYHLNETLRLDSSMVLAYVLLGVFWREAASLSWFEKAFVRIVYGESFDKTIQDSENILLRARELDPKCSYVYYELYWTYKSMGKKELAMQNLSAVLAFSPVNLREKIQQKEARNEWAALAAKN